MVHGKSVAAGLALGLALARPAAAQGELAPEVEAPILLRTLAYDRALERNGAGELVVAVLYDAASSTSGRGRADVVRALRGGALAIAGRTVKLVELNVAGGRLPELLREQRVAAAYLTPGLDDRLAAVVAASVAARVTTLGGGEQYARHGVAVSLAARAGRPQVLVNLASARSEGADLTSALLGLATVIQ